MNKLKILIFVLFILVLSLSVYADKCEDTFVGHTCMSGSREDLSENNNCKQGKVCSGDYCCGTTSSSYCCKPFANKCERDFGSEGFTCKEGSRSTLKATNDCKSGEVCSGDYCCGSAANTYCCKSTGTTTTTAKKPIVDNFLSIKDETTSINELIAQYQGLSVPPETLNYEQLHRRSADVNTGIKALYEEASGYKEIAILQREYLGIPKESIKKKAKKIIQKRSSRKYGKKKTAAEPEEALMTEGPIEEDLSGQPCGDYDGLFCIGEESAPEEGCMSQCFYSDGSASPFMCCEIPETEVPEAITAPHKETNDMLIDGDGPINIRIVYREKGSSGNFVWKWCRTDWSPFSNKCDGFMLPITSSSPSSSEDIGIEGKHYRAVLRPLKDKNLESGLDHILTTLINIAVRNDEILKWDIRWTQGEDFRGQPALRRVKISIEVEDNQKVNVEVGSLEFKNVATIQYQSVVGGGSSSRMSGIVKGENYNKALSAIRNQAAPRIYPS